MVSVQLLIVIQCVLYYKLQCNMPTYVGDGRVCGLDSDSDGFPEGLNCSQRFFSKVWILTSHVFYCLFYKLQDLCPDIYSVLESGEQSDSFCTVAVVQGKDEFV